MNKFKKIGLTALAGSLVTMGSATAGEMSVSGSIGVTLGYGTLGGNSSRAIGSDRDVAFTGSGELDNGTTFSMNTLLDDNYDVSGTTTTITVPNIGSFYVGTGYGLQSGRYDEEVPQAYEQISDAKQTMANLVGNYMDGNAISYTSPTFDLMGASITVDAGYSPQAADAGQNDGSNSSWSNDWAEGKELGVRIGYEALQLGFYGAERENKTPKEKQMIIKEKTIKVADNRKQWITMWVNEKGQYCIGRIGFGGMRIAYRKGQKNYIERMWEN